MKTLICFTASFPYGTKETYFENELYYLAQHFTKIIIIPQYNPYGLERRITPENVEILDVLLKQGRNRLFDFIANFYIPMPLIREFFAYGVFLKRLKLKKWLLSVLGYSVSLCRFKRYGFPPDEVILYTYWANQEFFIDDRMKKFIKVVRMHGADFYEERNEGYLPLRKELYTSASLLLPISVDISKRLSTYYKINLNKVFLSYLGVTNEQSYCTIKSGNVLKVVSCSNVYPLKRIHRIYEILKNINSSIMIEWIHIGAGVLLDELKEKVSLDTVGNIKFEFVGQKSQKELREIYQNNYFDFFINTSEHEGLPVSIMEAFSYGIPSIATNVGGTCEIVNNSNGVLIEKDFCSKRVAEQIESIVASKAMYIDLRKRAFETWNTNFNALRNYPALIEKLDNLKN